MGFSNQMCMLSNTPIAEGSKVKLFILVAGGVHGQPVFRDNIFYPWDVAKILGGVSMTARYVERSTFEIENDIKSQYILSVLRNDQDNPGLTFEEVFDSIHTGGKETMTLKNVAVNKSAYLRYGLINAEIYEKMVAFHKEKALSRINHGFEHYVEMRDKFGTGVLEDAKEYRMEFHVGSLHEYAADVIAELGHHIFGDLKRVYGLTDEEALNVLLDDMVMMNIFFECSILLAPRPMNDVHSSQELKQELFKRSHELLYDLRQGEFITPKHNVKVFQYLHINDIKEAFKYESYHVERKSIEDFEAKHADLKHVHLNPAQIQSLDFLGDYLDNPDMWLTIVF